MIDFVLTSPGSLNPPLLPVQDKTVLVTGGAGSLGSILTRRLLEQRAGVVRVLDSDEYGLAKLKRTLGQQPEVADRLRLLLGDIRDVDRLRLAMRECSLVYHCAAIKNLEVSEYNPIEACKTNIAGTSNLVEAAFETRPEKFVFVSSDKAVHFSTLYGATKFAGEKIVLWANGVQDNTKFTVVRPGNFLQSRGNVFEIWAEQLSQGKPLTITHPEMRRYFLSIEEAADFLLTVTQRMQGGEIYIPKMREEKILDLALSKSRDLVQVGIRPGEHLKEQLYTEEERALLKEEDGFFVIRTKMPQLA